jgi:hypothetical protein
MKKIIILALISLGCSTRKVEKKSEYIKQQISVKQNATIAVKNDIKTEQVDTSFMWKKTFIPMNSYLPFTVDGKHYQNVRIETTKIKKGLTILKEDNSALKATISTKKNIETKVETKEKKQERYGNTLTIFYWIVIIILSYITYDYYILKK